MTRLDIESWPISIPGSKRKIIGKLWNFMPKPSGFFVIPFFGTGVDSGFMVNHGFRVIGGDSQKLLIDWHKDAEACMDRARKWATRNLKEKENEKHNKAAYLKLRKSYNSSPSPWKLWTLGRLSFSQLIRHNRIGRFNASWGGEVREFPGHARIRSHVAFVDALERLDHADFETTIRLAKLGDVVYCDPPYYGTFDAYTAEPFDSKRLIASLLYLRSKDITWAVSNSTKFLRFLLKHCPFLKYEIKIYDTMRSGNISVNYDNRQQVPEILIVWNPAQCIGQCEKRCLRYLASVLDHERRIHSSHP